MSTTQPSTQWISLKKCPIIDSIRIPMGIDRNNYIVIDYDSCSNKINCIYKYNIDNDKWIKMNSFNNVKNISTFSASLNVKRQILFLFHYNSVTEISLNTNHIIKYDTDDDGIDTTTKTITVNDSLMIVGGNNNDSILKWNSENK
eukprot:345271_1